MAEDEEIAIDETLDRWQDIKISASGKVDILSSAVREYKRHILSAFENLDLSVAGGERIALVGDNGTGKTTLIKLLCRLYDPTEGKILLNGTDIREYDYEEYLK